MASPRHPVAWKYLGFAVAPATMTMALPTTTHHEGFRARDGAPPPAPRFAKIEPRANYTQPVGDGRPKKGGSPDDSDDENDGDDSDDEDDEPGPPKKPLPSHSSIASATASALPDTQRTILPERLPSPPEEEAREHWSIALGAIASFVAVCLICFALWKFRAVIAQKVFRRKGKGDNDFKASKEKAPIITGPVGGPMVATYPDSESPMSERRRSGLFGASTTVYGSGSLGETFTLPYPPAPALAPSTAGLERAESRRKLIRRSLLHKEDIRRVSGVAPSAGTSFYLEEEPTRPRKTKRESLSLRIQVPGGSSSPQRFAAPLAPESPEAANMRSRFSWITPPEAHSVRSSMASEPARFRGINSWVSNVAVRTAKKAHIGSGSPESVVESDGTSAVPETPVEFRQHPGAEIKFGGPRIGSRVLDMRLDARS
ncbi:hypothetical protein FN846DRAFT_909373 [Sphaerosporella brunnea]|uniref:Uncharacterized protein n=1 Tax=Sphaerosporella brunnea TaxID=1250544 RepID=A0A5J5ER11_9PEZI|nr:hypothetical protein FN846DRAFT_909373 [Sphaerosporella brunnea]